MALNRGVPSQKYHLGLCRRDVGFGGTTIESSRLLGESIWAGKGCGEDWGSQLCPGLEFPTSSGIPSKDADEEWLPPDVRLEDFGESSDSDFEEECRIRRDPRKKRRKKIIPRREKTLANKKRAYKKIFLL